MTELIRLDDLQDHPDNPRLVYRDDVIEGIANQIEEAGKFDEAHALLVRPYNGHYQILQGHHRKRAALKAGVEIVPCWVREMGDDEAYMQLALSNVQGELSPLEIGIHALKVKFDKRGVGAQGGGLKGYAESLGYKATSKITEYRQAAKVLNSINSPGGINEKDYIDKAAHLAHIHKAPEETWQLLAEWITTPNDKGKYPSAKQVENIVKPLAKFQIPSEYESVFPIYYLAKSYLEKEKPKPESIIDLVNLIRSIERLIVSSSEEFDFELFPFTIDVFRAWLIDGAGTYSWDKAAIETYRYDVMKAAQDAYKPLPADCKVGEWYQMGDHLLYCGDTSKSEFWEDLPEVAFAFADPPYNAEVDSWDKDFIWGHDWLYDKADVVAVTPGIESIQTFFKDATAMAYSWSMAAWIKNGMTRGKIGFGNWVYIALFSRLPSLYKNSQDFFELTISNNDTADSSHKGRKPPQLMKKLLQLWGESKDPEKNNVVIDPFLGSGTTLFEADQLNMKCIGGEISPAFCNAIIDRWQTETGQRAELINHAKDKI